MNQSELGIYSEVKTDNHKNSSRIFSTVFRVFYHPAIPFIIFFILMFGLFSLVKLYKSGDDAYFSSMYLSQSLPEYLTMRFQTWSGRLFVDALLYYFTGPLLFLWKWLCAFSITISAFVIYHFVTFNRKMVQTEKIIFAYLSCFFIFLISSANLDSSVFWVTGSLNYLVPFTVGLIGFIPFFHSLQKEGYSPNAFSLLYLIPAALTAMGQEQISLCFTCFSLAVLLFLLVRRRKISGVLWGIFVVSLILQILSLTAPGNTIRFNSETASWFPTFTSLQITRRISLSFNFLLDTMINQWRFLLTFLWLITGTLLLKKPSRKIAKVAGYISLFLAILMVVRFIISLDSNFSKAFLGYFNDLWHFHYLSGNGLLRLNYILPYLLWGIAILLIPISILLLFKKTTYSLFYILIYLAAMASIIMVTFSPTLYASGGRTSFVSNMLLILLLLLLLRHEGIVKIFAILIMIIALFRLGMYYSTWLVDGFMVNGGVLNYHEIPFVVFGK